MKQEEKFNPIICVPAEKILPDDIYLKSNLKTIGKSLKTVFGVIRSEFKKLPNDFTKYAFANSILINFLGSAGLLEIDKDEFLKHMCKVYDDFHLNKIHSSREL